MTDELQAFIDQCWRDHADDPAGVAARIPDRLVQVDDEDGVLRMAGLIHHVHGEHLARWDEGLALLDRLRDLAAHGDAGAASLARCRASLRLCAGGTDLRPSLGASDASRVAAMAAANLAGVDAARARVLLGEAVRSAGSLPDGDPALGALAGNANNLASSLADKPARSADETALMLEGAAAARQYWERAGGWLEVQRAEHQLAACCIAAGDGPRAIEHAQRCAEIVRAHDDVALEAFFAAEVMARAAQLAGDDRRRHDATQRALAAFERLSTEDRRWCRATLDALTTAASESPAA